MKLKSLDTFFQKALVFLVYFTVMTLPLIWTEANAELFEFPKMVFVYLMTILIGGFWVARMVISKKILIKRSWFDYPILAFLFSQIMATVLSMHRMTSLFGYYTRLHGGLISTICYIILFYAISSTFTKAQAKKLIGIYLGSLFVASLIALPEHYGYALSCFIIESGQNSSFFQKFIADCWVQDIVNRIFGTFGQPNWLAAYIVSLLPLSWTLLFKKKSWKWKSLFGLLSFLSLLTLWYTGSDSGLAAAVFGLGVFTLLLSLRHKKFRVLSYISGLGLASLTLLFTTFMVAPTTLVGLFDEVPGVSGLEVMSNFSQEMSPTGQGTNSFLIRQIVWDGAADIIRHNPIFGTGVETFAYSYYKYRPAAHNLVSEWDFLYNKAHNELLNIGANSGLVGLLSYLSILVVMSIFVVRKVRDTKTSDETSLQLTALLAGYVALFVSNTMGFSTVAVGVVFFLFPAIALSLTQTPLKINLPSNKIDYKQITGLVLISIVGLYCFNFIARYYYADTLLATGRANSDDLAAQIDYYSRAIKVTPHTKTDGLEGVKIQPLSNQAEQIYNEYANTLSKASYSFATQENYALFTQLGEEAFRAAYHTLTMNPVHNNFYKSQAGVFIRLGVFDPTLLETALTIVDEGISLAPTDAKLYYNAGLLNLDLEATDSAQKRFEEAVELKTNYEAARLELAELYEKQGQTDKALEQYQFIVNYIAPKNSIAKQGIERLSSENID